MSISKIRVRSALTRHNTHHESSTSNTTKTTATTVAATISAAAASKSFKLTRHNVSPTNTAELPKSHKLEKDQKSPKVLQKQKSKISPLSNTTTNAPITTSLQKQTSTALAAGTVSATIVAGSSTTTSAGINNHAVYGQSTTTAATNIAMEAYNPSGLTTPSPSPTPTTIIPQSTSNLLKIEPFVPSLGTRLQKPIRRSYSTLSTTSLTKKRLHGVNNNLAVNLGYIANNHHSKTPAAANAASIVQGTTIDTAANHTNTSSLPKVTKHAATAAATGSAAAHHNYPQQQHLRSRRQPLRGPITRQRSKSTSSSNSASNRPITSLATAVATTPTLATPCTPPQNAVVIPQPNGICRIQRNVKEQEKLPDRINYDKRGLTAIPIFENEANLRLLSLQHNLINTFHIPKEVRSPTERLEGLQLHTNSLALAKTTTESGVNLSPNTPMPARSRFPLPHNSPNHEATTTTPVAPPMGLATMANNAHLNSGGGFGAYMLRRNKLLHRSINLNNVNLQQNAPATHSNAATNGATNPLRFAMRRSKSFVNNFNLQYQINKRGLQNPRASFLKKAEMAAQLKSFDSSTSTLTSESTVSTTYLNGDIEEEDEHQVAELEIKNKQLLINYGNIFSNLVFLDLYNNQIERIASLDGLTSLTVLLLGKNRITDISGLASLKSTLKVLDLHGNKLCSIANKINCLRELKSLNLAGNQIRQINHNDFMGLSNLKELNLKRNKLKRINGFQHLAALERLWLCHNDLHKVDDMASISQAYNVIEITIENNPVSLAGDCVSFLVSHLPKLQTLSQMPITDQVRKAAMTWRNNKELSEQSSQQGNKEAFNLIRREEIISNARTNWELLRSQQMLQQQAGNGAASNSQKPMKAAAKRNYELEKITEANEQSYEEFIKLPPIEAAPELSDKDKEERTSSASSLGPNVNSSSSCYTSADEEEALKDASTAPDINSKGRNDELCEPKQETNECCSLEGQTITKNEQSSPTPSVKTCCTPTLTIQFPLDSDEAKMSSQHQNPNHTPLMSCPLTMTTSTMPQSSTLNCSTPTATRPSTPVSPTPSCSSMSSLLAQQTGLGDLTTYQQRKRYMTGSLMRSQTIVGTGAANGAGYAIKANGNTANQINILRYHPAAKVNAANTATTLTTSAGIALTTYQQLQQTAFGGLVATSPHHIMPSSLNGTLGSSGASHTTTSLNAVNKTLSNTTNASSQQAGSSTTAAGGGGGATSTKLTAIEREREQGGDYLIEICGRYLNIYGQGALRFIDKQWNPTKANDVHTLNFSYINFNNITAILSRIKVRFPHAENFVFRETNINCLGQINALAELQGITSVFIDPEGNPLTQKDLWRQYAIYRLSHWGLKTLNGQEVLAEDVDKANGIYAGLSDLILWSMPDAMLQPLLTRLRLDESCTASKMLPKQWLQKPDNRSLRLVVGKEALQWKKSAGGAAGSGASAGAVATGSTSSSNTNAPNSAAIPTCSMSSALTQREQSL
uniref:Dynein axonemal assembly factor 1 homolog n=1 Tax=Stomoxys calcitrans TaxID=35570 RepID=A0A1I8PTW4_STOCA